MSRFKVSDKVVYVGSDDPTIPSARENLDAYRVVGFYLVKEEVYVVEAVVAGDGIALVGSTVISRRDGNELGWNHRVFRKLEEVQEENRLRATRSQETTV